MDGTSKPVPSPGPSQPHKQILPPGLAAKILGNREITVEQFVEATTGPLPDPKVLKEYDQVLPGAADRIFGMAEREQRHQHDLQDYIIRSDCVGTRLGQIFAFAIGLTGMIVGAILIYADKTLTGLTSFFTPLAALAGIYFYETRRNAEHRKEASQANPPPDAGKAANQK